MPVPAGFTQHMSGHWMKTSDQSGPYMFDGTNMIMAASGTSASSGNVANASAVATLAAVAGKTNYLSGLVLSAGGATLGLPVSATVTGLAGGTATFTFAAPAGALIAATPLVLNFNPPIPASGVNVAIVVTLPALGAGNTNAAATAWGYVQ
jgi:hypothetical protein